MKRINDAGRRTSISVVVPSYNQGRFLRQCLSSIVRQLQIHDELIVVDGGSTDESVAVIKEFGGQITRWVSEADSGQADAVNKGVEWATKEIIVWVNSDDALMPGALDHARAVCGKEFCWGVFSSVWINEDCTDITFFPAPLSLSLSDFRDGAMPINQPSCIFSRQFFQSVGGLNVELRYSLDFDLFIRFLKAEAPVIGRAPFGINRVHGETKTSQRDRLINELGRTARVHFGDAATAYPRSFASKFGLSLSWRFGLRFPYVSLLDRLWRKSDLPGYHSSRISRVVRAWLLA